MSKRSRDPLDDPKSGPSKNQLRGLAYVGQKPAFLQNALSALQGGSQRKGPPLGADGRPAIPTRPDGEQEVEESEEDEWDFGRGEEAPTVVVLKEGKHIDRDEMDRLRAQGESTRPTVGRLTELTLSPRRQSRWKRSSPCFLCCRTFKIQGVPLILVKHRQDQRQVWSRSERNLGRCYQTK